MISSDGFSYSHKEREPETSVSGLVGVAKYTGPKKPVPGTTILLNNKAEEEEMAGS